jgi:phage/plasmid-associated DNA primase
VKETPACVQPWIDHIHNIVCRGNADQAKTITQWLAHLIQKPTQKAFAVILYGGQGTGKSILYEFFTRCIGKDLGLQVGKLEDLTQTHNTHVRGKLIINANEATNEPCIRDVNILKGLITETDLIINPKGVNQYTVSNYSRLLITSNYKQCMRLDADDRRYFCLEISDAKKNNDAYFAPLVQSLTNEATQHAFFDYLSNYDISDFHHQRPPMSAMKRDMIGASADNVILFMKDVCENEVVGLEYEKDTVEITPTCADVFELYIVWCKANDEKGRRQNKTKFAEQLKGLFEIAVVRPRVNGGRERRFQIQRDVLLGKFKTLYMNDNFEYMVVE